MRATKWLFAVSFLCLGGCNPFYVIQAGMTQSEILLNRRDIAEVLGDPETPQGIRSKLELVAEVRNYAESLSLKPGGTFRTYSALDRDILAWIVLAAKPDSFAFYTWWFPIVGSVPYKGYFSPEGAKEAAQELQEDGYETLVRGTQAFSTLGWFDDPIMTPMLRNEDHEVVNTVIHEVLHTTLWVVNHVAFNESLANFVGHQGAISFYRSKLSYCQLNDQVCHATMQVHLDSAERSLTQALDVSRTLSVLVPELKTLYQSEKNSEEKLKERETIFSKHIDPLRGRYPELKFLKKAHNAELMQLQLYYSNLDQFLAIWEKCGAKWQGFITQMDNIAHESRSGASDPFRLLDQRATD